MNAVGGGTRPWNSDKAINERRPHYRIGPNECALADARCAGSKMARSVALLPDVAVTIVLCDAHDGILARRAEAIQRELVGVRERLRDLERTVRELRREAIQGTR